MPPTKIKNGQLPDSISSKTIDNTNTINTTTTNLKITGGTNGQALTTDGSGNLSWASAGGAQIKTTLYTSSGTWTPESWTKLVHIAVIGAGGGGGSGRRGTTAVNRTGGGGGGSGAMVQMDNILRVNMAASYTVTIGAGGNGGGVQTQDGFNGINGLNGGDTFFQASTNPSRANILIQAGGGTGGLGGSAVTQISGGNGGGAAGFGSYGSIQYGAQYCSPGGSGGSGNNTAGGTGFSNAYTVGGSGGAGAAGNSTTSANGGAARAPNLYNSSDPQVNGTTGNGTSGLSHIFRYALVGAGATGGGYVTARAGASGGIGANYGGGGGGGSASDAGFNSGAGGNGAGGCVVVIEIG